MSLNPTQPEYQIIINEEQRKLIADYLAAGFISHASVDDHETEEIMLLIGMFEDLPKYAGEDVLNDFTS